MGDDGRMMDDYRGAVERFRRGFRGGMAEDCYQGLVEGTSSLEAFEGVCREVEQRLSEARERMEGWKEWGGEDFERELAELDRQLGWTPGNSPLEKKDPKKQPPEKDGKKGGESFDGREPECEKHREEAGASGRARGRETVGPERERAGGEGKTGWMEQYGEMLEALRKCAEERRKIEDCSGNRASEEGLPPPREGDEAGKGLDALGAVTQGLLGALERVIGGEGGGSWAKARKRVLGKWLARTVALKTKEDELRKREEKARARLAAAQAKRGKSTAEAQRQPLLGGAAWARALGHSRALKMLERADGGWNETDTFPEWVRTETLETGPGGESFPLAEPFPLECPLEFAAPEEMGAFLFRLLRACPVGAFEAEVLDHEALGRHGIAFSAFRGAQVEVFRVAAKIDEEMDALGRLTEYCGTVARERLTGGEGTWKAYNAKGGRDPLPYKIVAVHSFRGWGYRHFEAMEQLIAEGASRGVGVMWTAEALEGLDERERDRILRWGAATVPAGKDAGDGVAAALGLRHREERLPESERRAKWAADYAEATRRKRTAGRRGVKELFGDGGEAWTGDSREGLEAVIGWDESGAPVSIRLNQTHLAHALVGGQTGRGKSNLLHVIACSLCAKYRPEELLVEWVDMKDGVEANRYVDPTTGKAWLPNARTILATHAPSAAAELLQRIDAEKERRNAVFKRAGTGSLAEWRSKTGMKMPQVLLIADEFTKIFSDEDTADTAAKHLGHLLAEGRSSGIHVLLATQDTDMFRVRQSSSMLNQLAVRLALGDEKGVLESGNRGAAGLEAPWAILNEATGLSGKNRLFAQPQLIGPGAEGEMEMIRRMFEKIAERNGGAGTGECRVVDHMGTVAVPEADAFSRVAKRGGRDRQVALWLGRKATLEGGSFVITLDVDAPRDHLLVAGTTPMVQRGLLAGVLGSLAEADGLRALVYDPLGTTMPSVVEVTAGMEWLGKGTCGPELRERLEALRDSRAERRVLVVLNHHRAAPLARGVADYAEAEEGSACAIFEEAFAAAEKAFTVVVFTSDPEASSGAEYGMGEKQWNKFAHRIGFGLDRDALRLAVPGSERIGEEKNRYLYRGPGPGITDFLPFGVTEDGDSGLD